MTETHPLPRRLADLPAEVGSSALLALLEDGRPPARSGDAAETLLCVHGLGHDAWDWGPLVARRPRDLSVVTFDLPGFGPAVVRATPRSVLLADLVTALVERARQERRPPVVVASSLGGHAALLAALDHPELFAGLLLLAPGGLVEVPGPLQAVLRAYYAADAIAERPEEEVVRNSRRIFVTACAADEPLALRKLAVRRSDRAVRASFASSFSSVVDDVFGRPVLDRVHRLRGLPIHALFGDGDVVVPLSAGRALEDRAAARLTVLDRCGHCPHLEHPDRSSEIIFAFARDVFANAQSPADRSRSA